MAMPTTDAAARAHDADATRWPPDQDFGSRGPVEAELRHVAYELHDGPAQSVAAAQLILDRVLEAQAPRVVRTQVARAQQMLGEATKELRELMGELRPSEEGGSSLTRRLTEHVGDYERRFGIGVVLKTAGPIDHLPEQIRDAVFRIVQEALTNVRRHACARTAHVGVRLAEGTLTCRVVDEGCGFELSEARNARGLGLASMRERARSCGGELLVLSTPGSGTAVEAVIPTEAPWS